MFKFKKNIYSIITLLTSIFLFIFIFYKSEIYWNGSLRDYYLKYYFLSLFIFTYSIITFFINQKIKEYLIIINISFVFSLYFAEGYLTFGNQFSRNQILKEKLYKEKTGKKWEKDVYKVYKDLKKYNKEVFFQLGSLKIEIDENLIYFFSSIENSTILSCNENGYYSTYFSDRFGFNNPDEEWNKKEIEYLLIGASNVAGSCVNRPNDIASNIRALSNKSVLNLGTPGIGPLAKFAILREYLKTDTKKILWFFSDITIKEIGEINDKLLINYLNDLNFSQNLKLKTDILKKEKIILHKKIEKEINSKKYQFVKLYKLRKFINSKLEIKTFKTTITYQSNIKKIFELTKNLAIKNNSKLYVVYLPLYDHFGNTYNDEYYNLIKIITNELKIPFIDMYKELFEKEQNPLKFFPFELPGHYNVEGYKKVSESLYKLIKN